MALRTRVDPWGPRAGRRARADANTEAGVRSRTQPQPGPLRRRHLTMAPVPTLSDPGHAHVAAHVRALRHLPAAVPDLPGARRGDGLAARAPLPDARGGRGTAADHRAVHPSPRSLSRLPRVRDRVSGRRALRLAAGDGARGHRAPRDGPGDAAGSRGCCSRTFPHPDRLGPLLGLARRYQRWGLQTPRPAHRRARALSAAGRHGRLARRVPEPATVPEYLPARGKARGRVAVLAGCVQRHLFADVNHDTVAAAVAGRLGRGGAARAGVLRRARAARRPRRGVPGARAGTGRGPARGRRLRRHQRRRLRLGHARVRSLAARLGRPRGWPAASATSPRCWRTRRCRSARCR